MFLVEEARRAGDTVLLSQRPAGEPQATLRLSKFHAPEILFGHGSLSEAARTAAVVEALHAGTTVVLVAEDDHIPEVTNLHVHPKWESFDELAANLERMHVGLNEVRAERH